MSHSKPRSLNDLLFHLLLERLFLPSLVVTLLAIVLTGWLWGRSLGNRQLQQARWFAETVDEYVGHARQALRTVANVAPIPTLDGTEALLQGTVEGYEGYFIALYRLDAEGVVIAHAPPSPNHLGLDLSRKPFFALARTQASTISLSESPLHAGSVGIYLTERLPDGGMVVGELSQEALQETIISMDESVCFATDHTGKVLIHPDLDRVAQQADFGNWEIVKLGREEEKPEATRIYRAEGRFMLGAVTQLEETGWIGVAQTPLFVAYGPYVWTVGIILVLLPTSWLAMLLVYRQQLGRYVGTPLTQLSQQADALATGDFSQRMAISATPTTFVEMDRLVANFESMRQSIRMRQDALRESEARLRAVVYTATDGIITIDGRGCIVSWNRGAEGIFGYSAAEMVGRPIDLIIPEPFHDTFRRLILLAIDTDRTGLIRNTFEITGVGRDDQGFPAEVSWAAWKTNGDIFLTGIVRDISERKQAKRKMQRLLDQQIAVTQLALALREPRNLPQLYHTIYEHVKALMDVEAFIVSSYDSEEQLIRAGYVVSGQDVRDASGFPPIPLEDEGRGSQSQVIWSGEPLYVPDWRAAMAQTATEHTILDDGTVSEGPPPTEALEESTNSALLVPLKIGRETLGVMQVQSHRLDAYTQEDIDLLSALANVAAVAIQNAWLYEAAHRRAEELAVLNELAQALTARLDVDQVLEEAYRGASRLLDTDNFFIGVYNPERHEITFPLYYNRGKQETTEAIFADCGLSGYIVAHRQSLLIRESLPEWLEEHEVELVGEMAASWLGVPLVVGERVLGVMAVQDYETARAYDVHDQSLLRAVANQTAVTLESARLYRELLKHAEELEERVEQRTSQLRDQYARLEAILRSVSDGIIVTDPDGKILQINPLAQAWLNQTLSPQDATLLRETVQGLARRAQERPQAALEFAGLDLELRASPVVVEGQSGAVVVAVHDVSHLKALNRVKTRFVSNLSHELRTPITTIKLYANLMHRRPEKWRSYLETLTMEADRQAQLVEDILEVSRIDAGRLEISPQPTNLNELAEISIVSHEGLSLDGGLTLESHLVEPAPVALVDPGRMMFVLNNLMINAIRYTLEGGRIVVSTDKREEDGRTWATVTVADTGIGIPENELPHIFERFFRGEKPRLMQLSGTGLGLAIVREIVELHGGRVTVESQVGVGSTFTVWLPLANAGRQPFPVSSDDPPHPLGIEYIGG